MRVSHFFEDDFEMLAMITLKCIMDGISQKRMTVAVAEMIGSRAEDQLRFAQVAEQSPKYMEKVIKNIDEQGNMKYQRKRKICAAADRRLMTEKWIKWSDEEKYALGFYCILCVESSTGLIERANLDKSSYRPSMKGKNYLVPTAECLKWIEENKDMVSVLSPDIGPCIIKPQPWSNPTDGGFYDSRIARRIPAINTKRERDHLRYLHTPDVVESMAMFYKGLNIVQDTGWHINSTVLDTARLAQKRRIEGLDLPVVTDEVTYPAFNSDGTMLKSLEQEDGTVAVIRPGDSEYENRRCKFLSEIDQKAFIKWKRGKSAYYAERAADTSKMLDAGRTLCLAEKYRDYEHIYFVWQADSRGRLYPKSPSLNPQGCDLSKALLEFDTDFPIDINFLSLQISGVYGYDKDSAAGRVAWVNEHHDSILAIGTDPLNREYRDFLVGADKPWQFIAACVEYKAFHVDGRTTSRLWWAQDGSCNGIQHFSMMLKDEIGGSLVNLTESSDKPNDIYQYVCDHAEEYVKKDLNSDDEEKQGYAKAAILIGMDRKLTKRPVMIKPYSGTRKGAIGYVQEYYEDWMAENPDVQLPIMKSTKYEDEKTGKTRFKGGLRGFYNYIGGLIWQEVERAVVAATKAMKWLKKHGRKITKETGRKIRWSVPFTGFKVCQAKYNTESLEIASYIFGRARITAQKYTEELKESGMGSSIAPNFVHSLDAAHMLATVCAAHDAGITHFALVHDSFGVPTHQSNEFAFYIRDEFYKLYTEREVLEDFREQQIHNNPEVDFDKLPPMGKLNRADVYKSKFMFS